VRNSSYIFQRISTKLSHNYCNQVPQRILSGFFDSIIFHGITALCFFCTYVIYREYFLHKLEAQELRYLVCSIVYNIKII